MNSSLKATEKQFQDSIMELCELLNIIAFHSGDPRRDSVAGFPDLVLIGKRVIYVELKTEKGRTSKSQDIMHTRLNKSGVEFYLWRPSDWNEIKTVLQGMRAPATYPRPLPQTRRSPRPAGTKPLRGASRGRTNR